LLAMVFIQLVILSAALDVLAPIVLAPHSSTGQQRVIVIPVYSDDTAPETSVGVIRERMDRVDRYYRECSYSRVSISSTVLGWTRLSSPMDSYAKPWDVGGVEHGGAKHELFIEAISKVDSIVDFTEYDRLLVVHAGPSGQDAQANYSKIGTCHTEGWFATCDGRVFLMAAVVSEFDEVGAIAHELGHGFGAVDLYDYREESAWKPEIGPWALMSNGCYNGYPRGSMPSHMCVFTKHLIGWVKDEEIIKFEEGNVSVDLVPVSAQTSGYRAIRYDLGDGTYYLVEARSSFGFDAGLPDHGVLVLRINETRIDELRNCIQLQVPPFAFGMYDAALRPGEVFEDTNHSFSLRVRYYSEGIVTVDASRAPVVNWTASERFKFNSDTYVDKLYVAGAPSDIFDGPRLFAAVFLRENTGRCLQLYTSDSNGRDWTLLFSSNGSAIDFWPYCFSLDYYHGWCLMTGIATGSDRSFVGTVLISPSSHVIHLVNLTAMASCTLTRPVASANNAGYYVSATYHANGTSGIAYFRMDQEGWRYTLFPTGNMVELSMSAPPGNETPYVLYRNSSTTIYLTRFNSSDILWTFGSISGVYSPSIVAAPDRMVVSYLEEIPVENETLCVLHVEQGYPVSGFSLSFEVSDPVYVSTLTQMFRNHTDTFYMIVSTPTGQSQFVLSDRISNVTLAIENLKTYRLAYPRIDYGCWTIPPLFCAEEGSLYSLALLNLPAHCIAAPVYYYRPRPSTPLPYSVFTFLPVLLVVLLCVMLGSQRITAAIRRSKRLHRGYNGLRAFIANCVVKLNQLKPFLLHPIWIFVNVLIVFVILDALMRLPPGGILFGYVWVSIKSMGFFGWVALAIVSTSLLLAILLHLLDLVGSRFCLAAIIVAVGVAVLVTQLGVESRVVVSLSLGAFIYFALSWYVPWHLTTLEIIHTRWAHTYDMAMKSLQQSAAGQEEIVGAITSVLETLEHGKKVFWLMEVLTDEVVFCKDLRDAAAHVLGYFEDLRDALENEADLAETLDFLEGTLGSAEAPSSAQYRC